MPAKFWPRPTGSKIVKLILPGYSVTTQAVINVQSDINPPFIVGSSFAARSTLQMTVNFSEALNPLTATNPANYAFASGPTISNLTLAANGSASDALTTIVERTMLFVLLVEVRAQRGHVKISQARARFRRLRNSQLS